MELLVADRNIICCFSHRGRLVLGSTRPMSAVSKLHRSVQNMEGQLKSAQQMMDMQRLEISRLQEGVQAALHRAIPAGTSIFRSFPVVFSF